MKTEVRYERSYRHRRGLRIPSPGETESFVQRDEEDTLPETLDKRAIILLRKYFWMGEDMQAQIDRERLEYHDLGRYLWVEGGRAVWMNVSVHSDSSDIRNRYLVQVDMQSMPPGLPKGLATLLRRMKFKKAEGFMHVGGIPYTYTH